MQISVDTDKRLFEKWQHLIGKIIWISVHNVLVPVNLRTFIYKSCILVQYFWQWNHEYVFYKVFKYSDIITLIRKLKYTNL